jgi:Flp pilus assembly protein TadG
VAVLEFALLAPVVFLLIFSVLDVGIIGAYQMLLDDAVRDAARQVQMDAPAAASAANFVAAVCAEFALIAADCTTNLTYDIQSSTPAAGFASISPVSLPASGHFPNQFGSTSMGSNANVLAQVAYSLPVTLPFVSNLVTLTGTNAIVTAASVRMEPVQ